MKSKKIITRIIIVLIFAFFLLKSSASFIVSLLWYRDLGYSQLLLLPITSSAILVAVAFIFFFILLSGFGYMLIKTWAKSSKEGNPNPSIRNRIKFPENSPYEFLNQILQEPKKEAGDVIDITPINTKKYNKIMLLFAAIGSLVLALMTASGGWLKWQSFINATSFGQADPVFNLDISFYVFVMPLLNFFLGIFLFALIALFILSSFLFISTGTVHIDWHLWRKNALDLPKSIRVFWSTLLFAIFALFAAQQILSIFAVMYQQNGAVYGGGFTDLNVIVPKNLILAGIAVIAALTALFNIFKKEHRPFIYCLIAYVGASVLGGGITVAVQYAVNNNELAYEQPYIIREMKFTKKAFNIEDLTEFQYPAEKDVSYESIKANQATIDNVRINDPDPFKEVISQHQGLRYYYRFNDVDINRYMVDGKYRQVLMSPRELSETALAEKAATFVNLTMRYTHGFGVVASLANEIDNDGYANLLLKDLPVLSSSEDMTVKEPRIYYGELTNDDSYGYVVTNSKNKEFDYPEGENNIQNVYAGSTGIQFTPLNKLLLSLYFNTFRFYISNEVTSESILLMNRNIVERTATLFPWLSYDRDPYITLGEDGKLYWMLDAYTTTDSYPYSRPVQLTNGQVVNYMRNPVKVVVDAYNGEVSFYVSDPTDPIIQTYSKIFPNVFQDITAMPSNLREHLRYPEDYFNIQAAVLRNYHVNNPSVFYNKEDTWDIAKRAYADQVRVMDPYYTVMTLPNEKEPEFVAMLPYTPTSRQEEQRNNMVAWLVARSDGENYGKLQLYKLPKNREIQGPLMIDSLIDQSPDISSKLSLWGQSGSKVIRGNLIIIPIDNSFAYVEPIYLQADREGSSIPQMQAIVFAVDKRLIMVETNSLNTAIKAFFEKTAPGITNPPVVVVDEPTTTEPGVTTDNAIAIPKDDLLALIESLRQQLNELEEITNKLP